MEQNSVSRFNSKEYSNKQIREYLKKLNIKDDDIEMMMEVLQTLEKVLEKNKVRQKMIEWDREGCKLVNGKVILPGDMMKIIDEIIKDNKLYSFFLPEEYGGLGYSGFMIGPITDILATYDMPLQMLIMVSFTILESLFLYHKPDYDPIIQDIADGKRLGYVGFTEPQAGSNLKNVKSTSEQVGDEYVLNGTKIFISNGGIADTGLFLAQNIEDGKPNGTNVFLVDKLDNIEVLRLEEKMGLHANPTAQLRFENVTVPKEYLISSKGDGYKKVLERLLGMRIGVSFQGIAACKRAYDLCLDYASTREQFNKPIISFDAVTRKIQQMEKQLPRLLDYGYKGAYTFDRYLRGWIPSDVGAGGKNMAEKTAAKMIPGIVKGGIAHYYASCTKLYTTEITNYFLYDALQIHGGMGFISETEVNKLVRDSRVLSIYEGTSEIHEWVIGRSDKAISMLPRFKRPYQEYTEKTIYEKNLFERFPGLDQKI
jgi:alkylation response protein AidB-like acyl-CoA dehydrogenase